MLYLLQVYALVAVVVFGLSGMVILALLAWREVRAFAAARHRIQELISNLIRQPEFFATRVAISRSVSRSHRGETVASHKFQ